MNDMGIGQALEEIGNGAAGLANMVPAKDKKAADLQDGYTAAAGEPEILPQDDVLQTSAPVSDFDQKAATLTEFGEAFGKIKYLQNEQNLALPTLTAESMDEDMPFDSFTMAGKWLKEAANLENYWQGVQRFGEEFAAYKWAYQEGDLGEFNAKEFAKEAGKAGLRSVGSEVLRTSGNLLTMFGANMANGSALTTALTSGAGAVFPEAGKEITKIGQALKGYAEQVENLSFWAPDEQVMSDEPSWHKLANAVGSGSSQVLAMGLTAKFMGAGAAYGLFAGGGAGEMFDEAYAQSGDVDKANALAATNAGVTFAIDKIFSPLPEMVEKNAKATSKMIAKEMLGAPLREAGSEVLQQMLAENLVRKVGIDATQDLFEGLIESALGAFAGSSMLTTASGGTYYAHKTYENARRKILLYGVSKEELDLYQKNMQQLLESKPEAFDKILRYNLSENLRAMDKAAKQVKDRQERETKRKDVKDFQNVFETMQERFAEVLDDDAKARAAARFFEAGAISLYARDNHFTPEVLMNGLLPTVQRTNVESFLKQALTENDVSFQIIGPNAKNVDHDKLSQALDMERAGADAQRIWAVTNWSRGADGGMRSEISSDKARIKLWDNDAAEQRAVAYLRAEKNNMDDLRAYLAAGLDNSSNGVFGDYYQEFIKYLDKTQQETSWYDDADALENKTFAFDIVDPFEAINRENENLRLGMLFQSKKHTEEANDGAPFWEKLQNDHLQDVAENVRSDEAGEGYMSLPQASGQDYGFVSRDFNARDSQLIWSMIERRRFENFKRKFWNPRTGPTQQFLELAAEKEVEYGHRKDYNEVMAKITQEMNERREERAEAIREKGLSQAAQLFQDIDLEEAYRRFVVFTGDFSGEIAERNSFDDAGLSHTNSERFLEQEKYEFLNDIDKKVLLEHLDKVELLYRIDKHLKHLNEVETMNAEARNRLAKQKLDDGEFNPQTAERWRARLNLKNGMELPLGNLLEYQDLYDNYPIIEETLVRFTKLKDGETHHFYHDREKGYVLEFDADKLYYANMKEALLSGTQFIVDDIEGHDYALTDRQRGNYMDRHLYAAKKEVEDDVLDEMRKYVARALPDVNPNDFIVKRDMPVALAGLADSHAISAEGGAPEQIKYREVDYDKLTKAVMAKYHFISSPEGIYVRNYMYANLQRLKSLDKMKVMAVARQRGGYGAAGLPWSGLTSQGAMDTRASVRRMDMTPEELRQAPYFDDNTDLRAFTADTMDASDEFAQRVKEDRRNYKETLENLARGAYDSAHRTIFLFKEADVNTIVHETFHSFWDMMEQAENRNESHGVDFRLVKNDLRESLLREYTVQRKGDYYYIIDKLDGQILQEQPKGFRTSDAALDAAVRELFVTQFMSMFNGKTSTSNSGGIAEAADFYRRWLSTLALNLDITNETAGEEGKKLLKFLKKKIQ